jgi:phosphatidylinositol alpha-1,6-mannosyltransferase
VVAYSEELKNWLVKRVGVEASRIMVIPPHIDTERFRPDIDGTPIREKYSIGNAPLLMYVGSMNYKRGIDLLVEATFRIRAQFPAVKLMLVGPWPKYLYPYRTEVENQIKNSGLQEHIIMTDLVAWEDIPSYMASADILVSALRYTHTYTMPPMQKLPEYLAACKPIVVTSVGLTDYIKHETNALVVEPGSVDALAGAIVRLLKYPGLARSLAQEGRSLVAKSYNVERMVDAFESSLLSCIGNPEKG